MKLWGFPDTTIYDSIVLISLYYKGLELVQINQLDKSITIYDSADCYKPMIKKFLELYQ